MARWTKCYLKTILDSEGPLLSGELAQIICRKRPVERSAAKKIIERAYQKNDIKRLESLTFNRGEYLYYSDKTTWFNLQARVLELIKIRRPVIYRLWRALQKDKVLTHREALKITGLPTKQVGSKEPYKKVLDSLIALRLVKEKKITQNGNKIKFLVLNYGEMPDESKLKSYAQELVSHEKIIQSYLHRFKYIGMVKDLRIKTQVGSRIFDAVGKAVSRRHMVVLFDFNLTRETNDYDIEGLLDRVFSVYRKKFKQIVITYCVSKKFTREAQKRAMTGRFKQINLIKVSIENGQLTTKRINGISRQSRGELFENQLRYILRQIGFEDVQRGLKIYRKKDGLTDQATSRPFTDIDIITRSKDKVIICELKNWYAKVPQDEIENWIKNKLNVIVSFLEEKLGLKSKDIEAWFIVSQKPTDLDEALIRKNSRCNIQILSATELIEDVLSKINRFLANELKPIVLYSAKERA